MSEKHAAAFLFDMDGTLISSIAAAERIWGRWARRQGLDVAAFLRTIHGRRAIDTIRSLALPRLDPAVEARRIEREETEDIDGVVPIEGAVEFLAALPAHRWTIVTSAPRDLALARLGAAGLAAPAGMVTGEDITVGKPAPDCFLLGARRLGVDIRDCIVFEDAPAGIQAGVAAGAAVVVIGAGPSQPPHWTVGSYRELGVETVPAGLRLVRRVVSTLAAESGTAGPRH